MANPNQIDCYVSSIIGMVRVALCIILTIILIIFLNTLNNIDIVIIIYGIIMSIIAIPAGYLLFNVKEGILVAVYNKNNKFIIHNAIVIFAIIQIPISIYASIGFWYFNKLRSVDPENNKVTFFKKKSLFDGVHVSISLFASLIFNVV